MKTRIGLKDLIVLLLPPVSAALAQEAAPSPIATDRPGILFSSPTVGRGIFQFELGLPSVVLNESGETGVRSTSVVALLRYGIADDFELRLGGPLYNEVRTDFGPFRETGHGYGDLEVGAKWRVFGNEGARPAFALIPSVILPTGEEGFSAEDPVYQLNTMSEWAFTGGWGLSVLAGYLNGPVGGDRYSQETFAVLVSRTLADVWNVYGEAARIVTDLDGADDSAFLGAGVKYLVSNDFQLDLSFDRGVTSGSPDWLFGLGLSGRF